MVRVRNVSGPVHQVSVPSVFAAASVSICGPSAATTTPLRDAFGIEIPACAVSVSPANDTLPSSMSGIRIDRYSRM
jgi:hypothetical protein